MDPLISTFRRLKKILQRKGRSREDAEDLIQEAFLRMQSFCERGGQVRDSEAFLSQTVTRLAINSRRDKHADLFSEQQVEDLTFVVDTSPSPLEVLEAAECLNKMRDALDEVSRSTREIFFMHRLDGLSYSQIAQQMGVSISAIEKRIATAMARLALENEWKQE